MNQLPIIHAALVDLDTIIKLEYEAQCLEKGQLLSECSATLLKSDDMALVTLRSIIEIREISVKQLAGFSEAAETPDATLLESLRLEIADDGERFYQLTCNWPSSERALAIERSICAVQGVLSSP